jgi:hypothetical protein
MRCKAHRCARLIAMMLTATACNQGDEPTPAPGVMLWDSGVVGAVDAAPGAALQGGGAAMAGGGTGGGGAAVGGTTGGGMTGALAGGASGGTTGGMPTGTMGGSGSAGGATGGAEPAQDAGATQDSGRPKPILTVPTSSVPCGGNPCDTLANVCCESWSTTGFGTEQSCIPRMECNRKYSRDDLASNRVVPHACDGMEDCPAGQACCFIADGLPLCDFENILECNAKVYGPGGGRICADADKCVIGGIEFIGEGVPLGVLSCNDDADCQPRAGTSCQPEQDNTITTGRGVKARSYIKVCR